MHCCFLIVLRVFKYSFVPAVWTVVAGGLWFDRGLVHGEHPDYIDPQNLTRVFGVGL